MAEFDTPKFNESATKSSPKEQLAKLSAEVKEKLNGPLIPFNEAIKKEIDRIREGIEFYETSALDKELLDHIENALTSKDKSSISSFLEEHPGYRIHPNFFEAITSMVSAAHIERGNRYVEQGMSTRDIYDLDKNDPDLHQTYRTETEITALLFPRLDWDKPYVYDKNQDTTKSNGLGSFVYHIKHRIPLKILGETLIQEGKTLDTFAMFHGLGEIEPTQEGLEFRKKVIPLLDWGQFSHDNYGNNYVTNLIWGEMDAYPICPTDSLKILALETAKKQRGTPPCTFRTKEEKKEAKAQANNPKLIAWIERLPVK